MSDQDISSKEWKIFTLTQKKREEIDLWLAGVKVKPLLARAEIHAVACYEVPNNANVIDIRKEEREVLQQGTSYRHPEGDRWNIVLRVGDMVITKTIGEFHTTQNGTGVIVKRV